MRKTVSLAVISVLAFFCLSMASEASQGPARFPVKSGHLEYVLSGSTSGKKSVYFDDYGARYYELLEESTSVAFGKKTVTNDSRKLTIRDETYTYSIDLSDLSGTKIKNSELDEMTSALTQGMSQKDMEKMGKEMLEQMGGKILGKEKVLGRECEIVEVMGVKSWLYKQTLSLKSETSMMGMENSEIATVFEENISVPTSRFTVPEGATLEELSMNGPMEGEGVSEEIVEMSLSYERFEQAAGKISVQGYNLVRMESEPGEFYGAVFMNEESQSVYIEVSPLCNFSGYDGQDGISIEERFSFRGEPAFFCSCDDGETRSNLLFFELPSEEVMVSVISSTPRDKTELLKIADQIKF